MLGRHLHVAGLSNLEAPTLGTNLLTLMGMRGCVYLGFKIPERQN
jgi:hypothetical protein